MKVPLSWLREYVDVDQGPEALARALTFAGLEVEGLHFVGVPLPESAPEAKVTGLAWDRDAVVVGDLLEVEAHPDAERLVVARVEAGGGVLTTVTGAPNLFPYAGRGPLETPLKVAVATEGATVLDYRQRDPQPRRIERAAIRGVESVCSICSEKELGISDAHEGVIVFDADAPPAGTPLADYAGDLVIDVQITPNMARDACILGVAREVAALTGAALRAPDYEVMAAGPPVEDKIRIEIREPDLNPRFTATLLEGVAIGPSPYWLQRRLRLAGMRPINNIVDVTNYVMLELGQPLHAFDYDVLVERAERAGGEPPTLITRLPGPKEALRTLDLTADDPPRRLDDFTILVADRAGALSLGGIMGGEESEVSGRTTRVLLEAAAWNFINIRRTTRSQQIDSEAGYRFSRGVHPEQAARGNLRGIELMRRLAGGTVAAGMVDEYPRPAPAVVVELPLAEIERALGLAIPRAEVERILRALEFGIEPAGDLLRVTVPDHRLDVGEGVVGIADLIEEISRIYGYERIPETQIADSIPPQRGNPELEVEERVRDLLVDLGLQEVITYRLTTPEAETRARPPAAPADERPYVTLENPTSQERRVLRHELLPALLEVAERNARQRPALALFEIGQVFLPRDGDPLPAEPRRLALLLAGEREPRSWDRPAPEPMDFYDLKGVLDALLADLHAGEVRYEPARGVGFHPGRCARLEVAGRSLGLFGEVHPEVRAAYELPYAAVLAAELDFEALAAAIPDRHPIRPLPRYPAVYEDLALVVDEALAAAAVETEIRDAGGELLRAVELFDVYRGEQVAPGKKSLAYRLTYQSDEGTLTDQAVAELRRRILERLGGALGAELRQ